jgi:hypothetical protein
MVVRMRSRADQSMSIFAGMRRPTIYKEHVLGLVATTNLQPCANRTHLPRFRSRMMKNVINHRNVVRGFDAKIIRIAAPESRLFHDRRTMDIGGIRIGMIVRIVNLAHAGL